MVYSGYCLREKPVFLKTLVFSDPHLFRDMKESARMIQRLMEVIPNYDCVIYNGDIFELFYSEYLHRESSSLKQAQDNASYAAALVLEKIIAASPNTHHYYNLGNHEDHDLFKILLNDLAARYDNFTWNEDLVRYFDNLALHGDKAFRKNFTGRREEYPLKDDPSPDGIDRPNLGLLAARSFDYAYQIIEEKGLDILKAYVYPPEEVCRITLGYLKEHHPEKLKGVKNIFIGHTHNHFICEYESFIFYNTGSPALERRDFPIELLTNTDTLETTARQLGWHELRLSRNRKALSNEQAI